MAAGWRLAAGGWWPAAGGWRGRKMRLVAGVAGGWWLAAGGWRGRKMRLAAGGWWLVVAGWWLAWPKNAWLVAWLAAGGVAEKCKISNFKLQIANLISIPQLEMKRIQIETSNSGLNFTNVNMDFELQIANDISISQVEIAIQF